MMHRNRSRDPPPYHPGWGGFTRKLILEETTTPTVCLFPPDPSDRVHRTRSGSAPTPPSYPRHVPQPCQHRPQALAAHCLPLMESVALAAAGLTMIYATEAPMCDRHDLEPKNRPTCATDKVRLHPTGSKSTCATRTRSSSSARTRR